MNTGASLLRADPAGVKLKGMCAMLIEKKLLTQEEADDYITRYLVALQSDSILTMGSMMLQVSEK